MPDNQNLIFSITFSDDEWRSMKPRNQTYQEKIRERNYYVLTPFVWSNIVQEHFFLHTRLPCAISFKKSKVTITGKFFVTVKGRCVDCGSIFNGTIDDIPALDERYNFDNINI